MIETAIIDSYSSSKGYELLLQSEKGFKYVLFSFPTITDKTTIDYENLMVHLEQIQTTVYFKCKSIFEVQDKIINNKFDLVYNTKRTANLKAPNNEEVEYEYPINKSMEFYHIQRNISFSPFVLDQEGLFHKGYNKNVYYSNRLIVDYHPDIEPNPWKKYNIGVNFLQKQYTKIYQDNIKQFTFEENEIYI
jgi:hypothetical protein